MSQQCRIVHGLCLAVCLLVPAALRAEDVPAESIAKLRQVTDAAMDSIRQDDVPAMIDAMAELAGWNEEQRLKNLQKVAESRGLLRSTLGPAQDRIEFLKAQTLGGSFVRLTYLEHRTASAVAWRFTCYRSKNEWRLVGMTWDGNLESLFQERTSAEPGPTP